MMMSFSFSCYCYSQFNILSRELLPAIHVAMLSHDIFVKGLTNFKICHFAILAFLCGGHRSLTVDTNQHSLLLAMEGLLVQIKKFHHLGTAYTF